MRRSQTALYLTRGALIGAMYVALSHFAGAMGLASGVIQFRISEALTVLPLLFPEAIPGLAIGCLISNLTLGCAPWDTVFGTVATLIGAAGTYLMRGLPKKLKWLATLPPIVSNSVIVPFVLIYAYGVPDGYFFLMLTVFIGELVCAGILGTLLYYSLNKTSIGMR